MDSLITLVKVRLQAGHQLERVGFSGLPESCRDRVVELREEVLIQEDEILPCCLPSLN